MKKNLLAIFILFLLLGSVQAQTFEPRLYLLDGDANEVLHGYNGTLGPGTYAPTPTTDRFNNPNHAMYFDGTDYISIPITNMLSKHYTYSAWVTVDAIPSFGDYSWYAVGDNTSDQYFGSANDQFGTGFFISSYYGAFPNVHHFYTGIFPTLNTWYFLTVSFNDSTNISLYVNGVNVNTFPITFEQAKYGSSPSATIGSRYIQNQGIYNWHGKIDDFRFYPYPMNGDEIGNLFLLTSVQNEMQNDGFNIYPVPASESLRINIADAKIKNDLSQIEIYNTIGERIKVYDGNNFSSNGNYDLDISSLQKGAYILSLRTNDSIIHKKFIKS